MGSISAAVLSLNVAPLTSEHHTGGDGMGYGPREVLE